MSLSNTIFEEKIEKLVKEFIFEEFDLITQNNINQECEFILLSYAIQNSLEHFLDKFYMTNDINDETTLKMQRFLKEELILNGDILPISQINNVTILVFYKNPKEVNKVCGSSILKFLYFCVKYMPTFFFDSNINIKDNYDKLICYKNLIGSSIDEFKVTYIKKIIESCNSIGLIQNIFFSKIALISKE